MDVKEKLIQLIMDSTQGCARYWASLIADHLIANNVTILPAGAIILTKEEIAALNEYQKKHGTGGEPLEEKVPQQ